MTDSTKFSGEKRMSSLTGRWADFKLVVRRFVLIASWFVMAPYAFSNSNEDASGKLRVGAAAVELHATDEMVKNMDNIFKFVGTEKEGKEGRLRAIATVI